jgi:hypothetical protein
MGADPDVLLPQYKRGVELKRTPKSVRPTQEQAFRDLFSDYSMRYVYGTGGSRQVTGTSALGQGLREAFAAQLSEAAAGEVSGD